MAAATAGLGCRERAPTAHHKQQPQPERLQGGTTLTAPSSVSGATRTNTSVRSCVDHRDTDRVVCACHREVALGWCICSSYTRRAKAVHMLTVHDIQPNLTCSPCYSSHHRNSAFFTIQTAHHTIATCARPPPLTRDARQQRYERTTGRPLSAKGQQQSSQRVGRDPALSTSLAAAFRRPPADK